jgi:hypothetical protein
LADSAGAQRPRETVALDALIANCLDASATQFALVELGFVASMSTVSAIDTRPNEQLIGVDDDES